jgi:hypothetical protein
VPLEARITGLGDKSHAAFELLDDLIVRDGFADYRPFDEDIHARNAPDAQRPRR